MIEIKIPKEITEYKEKFLFGLTVRQCISIAAALGICIPLYIFGRGALGDDVTSWLVILIAVPVFGFGFIRYNGMTFERLVAVVFRQKFAEPQKRKYEEMPVFYKWREEAISNEIAHQTAAAKRRAKAKPVKSENPEKKKTLGKQSENTAKTARETGKAREMEFSVLGGSLNVKWSKRAKGKGEKANGKNKKQNKKQRKGNG